MYAYFNKLNNWLGKNIFIVVLLGLFLGCFVEITNSAFLRNIVIALFSYMTFVTALGTSFRDFLKVLRQPWIPLWILILVHIIAPFSIWMVGMIFYPEDAYIRLGYLIGAAIPIGVTSIIWTALVKGDTAASLVAVTIDTLVVPFVLPAFFHIALKQTIEINYVQMMNGLLLMVTIPSIIGMLLHDWTQGKVLAFSQSIGGATSKLALGLVIFLNSSVVMPQINWNLSMIKMLLVALFVVAFGFFLGYIGSFAIKERSKETVLTMMYNVGIRNNSCGLVIALSYFPPTVAIPLTLSILYQQPVATIISNVYKRLEARGL